MKLENLEAHVPAAVVTQIPEVIETFEINTPLRLAHFLAQCSHESADFRAVRENLNYSARALRKVFRKYFPDDTKALEYERKPEKIANLVYANRMGNGDESSGDGWKHRGRGYIQLTGHDNYAAFDKVVEDDILADPDLVATKYPLLSAAWFWDSRSLNTLADKGATDEDVIAITKKVNGGVNGLDERLKNFKKYYDLLETSLS
jgi:putative chitinase